jgi:hypothetical protein
VILEEGIRPEVVLELKNMGHVITDSVSGAQRARLGRGQVITRGAWWDRSQNHAVCNDCNVYWAGSDLRADGIVAGY